MYSPDYVSDTRLGAFTNTNFSPYINSDRKMAMYELPHNTDMQTYHTFEFFKVK